MPDTRNDPQGGHPLNVNLSMWHLVSNASLLVQFVLLLLLLASLASWTMIIGKHRELKGERREMDAFEQRFWSGGDLESLYRQLDPSSLTGGGAIFAAGYRYYDDEETYAMRRDERLEAARRAMRVALNREADRLEGGLAFLASVGSTSPYIGLFGTVWGIMNAFRALGDVSQATLAMVAPGIAEALIATAMGLFAAIPAVIAYNRFVNEAERLLGRYDNFLEEFLGLLQRRGQSV